MSFSKDLVAKRLKEARLKAKLSQKKLGIAAGIDEFSSSVRMNQYETGKHVPDALTLSRIAKILKVPLAYFYSDDEILAELLILFDKLNKSSKLKLLNFAKKSV